MEMIHGRRELQKQIDNVATGLGHQALLTVSSEPLESVEPKKPAYFCRSDEGYALPDPDSRVTHLYTANTPETVILRALAGGEAVGAHVQIYEDNLAVEYLMSHDPGSLRGKEGYVQVVRAKDHAIGQRLAQQAFSTIDEEIPLEVIAQAKVTSQDLWRPVLHIPPQVDYSMVFDDAKYTSESPAIGFTSVIYGSRPTKAFLRTFIPGNIYDLQDDCRGCQKAWCVARPSQEEAEAALDDTLQRCLAYDFKSALGSGS